MDPEPPQVVELRRKGGSEPTSCSTSCPIKIRTGRHISGVSLTYFSQVAVELQQRLLLAGRPGPESVVLARITRPPLAVDASWVFDGSSLSPDLNEASVQKTLLRERKERDTSGRKKLFRRNLPIVRQHRRPKRRARPPIVRRAARSLKLIVALATAVIAGYAILAFSF